MSGLSEEEIAQILEEARSESRRREFEESARICEAVDRAQRVTLEGILDWIDELRSTFGEPDVDREPWRGDDFRI